MDEIRIAQLKENQNQYLHENEIYCFPHFDRNDVWELGCDIVASCKEFDGPLAVEIYIGEILAFRYFPEKTGTLHEMWLGRKRNTVLALKKSSMLVAAELAANGQTIADRIPGFPNAIDYADCGGGFPLQTKDGTIVGTACVSGMSDFDDHKALMGGMDRFFRRRGWLK